MMQEVSRRQCPVVVSLGFQEATLDARVLKQARALAQNGYEVHLFCDWPKGFSQTESLDGVSIHRFDCFEIWHSSSQVFEELDFLKECLPHIHKVYTPFVDGSETLRLLKEQFGDAHTVLLKSYYKNLRGMDRLKNKLRHITKRLDLRFSSLRNPRLRISNLSLERANTVQGLFYATGQARSILFAENLLRQRIEFKPDIIHAHDIYTLIAGVVLARKFGAKLIYDAHEYEPCRFAFDEEDQLALLPTSLENDAFPYVDALITVSEPISALYEKRYFKKKPVIISNTPELKSVELDCNEPTPTISVRRHLGISSDEKIVVFTGMIQRENRGVDKVVQALKFLNGYRFVVLGPRDRDDDAWVLSLARLQGVSSQLHLLDPVKARDVPRAIASCDVAVVPFQAEGLNHSYAMPNKLFEAAFAGVPLCVSDLPEMRKFVESLGIGRVMDQTNPKNIADAIRDICENPERYAASEASRQRLQQEYSWASQKNKLMALYNELCYPED